MPLSIETIGAFAVTSLLIELTPGPNMAYLAIRTVSHGRRAGLAATAGIALGLLSVGLAAALGLAAVIQNSNVLYELLRWGGVAYLLWLAWDGWHETDDMPTRETASGSQTDRAFFRQGLITNLLNPKAAVFYIAVLPTFIDDQSSVLPQTVSLSVLYVAVATAVHLTITALAGTAQPFLENPVRRRRVRRALAVGLAMIALWFAYATSRAGV